MCSRWRLGPGHSQRAGQGALCCWIPLILFSVAVFEPGSLSRFLPGFALLFASLGFLATRIHWRNPTTRLLALCLRISILENLARVIRSTRGGKSQNTESILQALRRVLKLYS